MGKVGSVLPLNIGGLGLRQHLSACRAGWLLGEDQTETAWIKTDF